MRKYSFKLGAVDRGKASQCVPGLSPRSPPALSLHIGRRVVPFESQAALGRPLAAFNLQIWLYMRPMRYLWNYGVVHFSRLCFNGAHGPFSSSVYAASFAGQEGMQALRAFSTGEASLLNALQG